ncbi:zinc ribbon domain-containing protein [Streptosporangium algeriense]|uniref:Zinc ribbon domain-containing protein n=1 Tax=Streptosporangium algeriense TaxID=1682748 RepID=A0ABW3DGW3_9ACTN
MTKQRWNDADQWIWSEQITHEPLVSTEDFQQVQAIRAGRGRCGNEVITHKPHPTHRRYTLRGVLFCGYCDRRMQRNWNNGQPCYRCRYPAEYALANKVDHPKTVYLRETDVLPDLDRWPAREFGGSRRDKTIRLLAAYGQPETDVAAEAARRRVAECDQKLARRRAALEAGADPVLVAQRMAETQAQRVAAEANLRQRGDRRRMTREEIDVMVTAIGDLAQVFSEADPNDKADAHAQIGLRPAYQPRKS